LLLDYNWLNCEHPLTNCTELRILHYTPSGTVIDH
jgi:hypothetical protein